VGDALAVALIEGAGFKREKLPPEPSRGRLGRRLTLTVATSCARAKTTRSWGHRATIGDMLAILTEKARGGAFRRRRARKFVGLIADYDIRRGPGARAGHPQSSRCATYEPAPDTILPTAMASSRRVMEPPQRTHSTSCPSSTAPAAPSA